MSILDNVYDLNNLVSSSLEQYAQIYGQIQGIRAQRDLTEAAISAASYGLPTQYQNPQATAASYLTTPSGGLSMGGLILAGLALAGLAYFALRD
jgi:hypothetical protein